MPRFLILAVLAVGAGLVGLLAAGGFDDLAAWAAVEQHAFQNRIAQALRALRAGQGGALALLVSVCFAYGFVHAVGSGHGKILIGGYGLGRRVRWPRLVSIGLLSSLGQALSAIVLVYGGILAFGLTRDRLIGVAEDVMAPVSYGAIAAIGLWLAWRGLRRSTAARRGSEPPARQGHADPGHDGHDHRHSAGGAPGCDACGHAHGPSLADIDRAGTVREALALIAGIAARPCTGALFVLIITWQMGIGAAGIAGALAMALGTATVSVAVGLAASGLRGGLVGSAAALRVAAIAVPVLELTVGATIAIVALGLLLRAL